MAVLEDCPDEILLNIVSRLYRSEPLAGLTFACRRLRRLVAPFLADCKSFRRLKDVYIGGSNLPVRPVRALLKRPELSLYVLQARMCCYDEPVILPIDISDSKDFVVSEEEQEKFIKRAVDDFDLGDSEIGEELVKALNSGNPGSLLAILLLLHSNLEKLHFCMSGDEFWILVVMLKVLSSSPLPSPNPRVGFLALREVRLEHFTHCGLSLDNLAPFFLLPSIQKLSAFMLVHGEGRELQYGGEYGISTVTELIFDNCFIGVEALEQVLRIPKALERFRYECGGDVKAYAGEAIAVHYYYDYDTILDVVRRAQPGLDEANIEILHGFPKGWK